MLLLLRASNAWFKAVELGNLRLRWFYSEWARPTARLVAIGILLLGSSAVAANLIEGLMLAYTSAFREGDR
ncbi:hypothetical protein [Synechococcus sp. 1G10]|uniref:hypothetical protein n=1 Tax=Synechococcus sp. 1G10 TaxID=2025605 RepID=UPI000B988106|nr:hypothetical protein [Synechococcus sp. 1G10]